MEYHDPFHSKEEIAAVFLMNDHFKDILAKLLYLQKKGFTEQQIERIKDKALDLLKDSNASKNKSSSDVFISSFKFLFDENNWIIRKYCNILCVSLGLIIVLHGFHKFMLSMIKNLHEKRQIAFTERISDIESIDALISQRFTEIYKTASLNPYDVNVFIDVVKPSIHLSLQKEMALSKLTNSLQATIKEIEAKLAFDKYMGSNISEASSITGDIRYLKGQTLKTSIKQPM